MPTVSATCDIAAGAGAIFDFLADYRNIPQVQPQFNSARLAGEKDRCAGATVELSGRFHGMPMRIRNRIITYAPPYRLASISEGTVLSRNVWELAPIEGRATPATRVTLTIDYKMAGPLSGLFTGLAAGIFNKEIQAMTDESLNRLESIFAANVNVDGKAP